MKKRIAAVFAALLLSVFAGCGAMGAGIPPSENGVPDDAQSRPQQKMIVTVNGLSFTATLANSKTGAAFCALLPLTLRMSAMPHEKYCYLPQNLPTDALQPHTIREGDLLLYGENCVVLFYETFTSAYSYTRIGSIDNTQGLAAAVGDGEAVVSFAAV